MIFTFLVTFFAINYLQQSYRSDALQSTSEKFYGTNISDVTNSSDNKVIDLKPNDEAEGDASSKRNLKKIFNINKVKLKESVAEIEDLIDVMKVDEEIDSRFSNLRSILEGEEVQANGKLRDKTDCSSTEYELRNQFRKMVPSIQLLNLENKTEEEIWKEIYVDFSALNTSKMPEDERLRAKVLLNSYADAFQVKKARSHAEKLHPSDRNKYDLGKFNTGIVALGVENFMKAATQFCREEAAAGEIPIVSIGSGDGTVEKEIIAQYRERFGKEIRIQLVDPDPELNGIVDFQTVEDLIANNTSIVGNCAAFIIWPNPDERGERGYDIEAIRKLQPKAVLTVYECVGGSGSNNFRTFLHEDSLDELSPEEFGIHNWWAKSTLQKKKKYVSVDNYAVHEVARQKLFLPRIGASIYRMVKIIRKN